MIYEYYVQKNLYQQQKYNSHMQFHLYYHFLYNPHKTVNFLIVQLNQMYFHLFDYLQHQQFHCYLNEEFVDHLQC